MRFHAQLISLLAVLLTEAVLAGISNDPAQVRPSVGNPVPVFSARTADGVLGKLSPDAYSKPTIVLFYRGGWCPQRHASHRPPIACQLA
jgi:hypothetical protein